ncbi:MAG: hypothetical protein N2C14_05425, partial [Planctomycetales bacterium]
LSEAVAYSNTTYSNTTCGNTTCGNTTCGNTTCAGLILETSDGRFATSQLHDLGRTIAWEPRGTDAGRLTVEGALHWIRFETVSPWKLIVFRLLLLTVGRWNRSLIRWLLQRRLITGRKPCPVRLTRVFDFSAARLKVTDHVELLRPDVRIRRMSFASDLQASYVAATNIYQSSVRSGWTDLSSRIEELNRDGRITIERAWPRDARASRA